MSTVSGEPVRFVVGADRAGERLDRLAGEAVGSRRGARRLLSEGAIRVDGRVVRVASRRIPAGAVVDVGIATDSGGTARATLGQPGPTGTVVSDSEAGLPALSVVYRDEDLLVVDKPSGLPVQGTRNPEEDHLVALVERWLAATEPGRRRPVALHHRLDRGTSGLVVFALAKRANRGLASAFAERRVGKVYLARVAPLDGEAHEVPEEWSVEDRLLRETRDGVTRVRVDAAGKPASTSFRLTEREEPAGRLLVEARPSTGRTHQVRVHLAASGLPVLGDVKYGGVASSRLWLHAWKLDLPHPVDGRRLVLESEPPAEMRPQGRVKRTGRRARSPADR